MNPNEDLQNQQSPILPPPPKVPCSFGNTNHSNHRPSQSATKAIFTMLFKKNKPKKNNDNDNDNDSVTDGVINGILDQVMAGKHGALIELPTHVMQVKTARMIPMLDMLEAIPGAKVDFDDTDGVFITRLGIKAVVPRGRDVV
jgi:hypothetical protein